MSMTVFTSCNRSYEPFALPFIGSTLFHNDDAVVEVCVENAERFTAEYEGALAVINGQFPDRVLIRNGSFSSRLANSVRFLEEPQFGSTFTYIGDVDILILEGNLSQQHLEHMSTTRLPYSNVVRPGTQRLTGLHFTESICHYPLNLSPDFDTTGNDEHLLYRIVVEKGLPLPDSTDTFRPVHGFHLSLNRSPTVSPKTVHWGLSDRYLASYLDLKSSEVWRCCFPHFSGAYRSLSFVLDSALQAAHPELEIFYPGELKQHFSELSSINKWHADGVFEARRIELIQERKFEEAILLVGERIRELPFEAELYHQMAWLQAANKNVSRAVEFEQRACQLSPGHGVYRDALERYSHLLTTPEIQSFGFQEKLENP